MKHKFLTVPLAAVLALGTCFGLAACGNNGNEHEHTYTVENKCSVCGEEWEYTKSDALEYTKVVLDGVEGYDVRFGEYTASEWVQVGGHYEVQYHDKGRAFEGEKVVFPYGYNGLPVISIGRSHACTSDTVKSITVPKSVISWGYGMDEYNRTGAFSCSALEELNLPDGLSVYTRQVIASDDSFAAFPLCMVTLFDGIKKEESEICPLYDDPQYRENGALYIGNYLFGTNFEEPVDTLTVKDGTRVIVELKGAKRVVLPDSVEVIGASAFMRADLESIKVGNGIEEIGMNAFYMSNLTSITLPDKPIYIGTYAFDATPFSGNDANWEQQSLYIGNHLISAYGYTYHQVFEMKPGLKSIAGGAFIDVYCDELRIPSIEAWFNVRRGGSGATPPTNKLIVGGQEITEITIPSTVTEIPDYAFAGMRFLTNVTLHNGITKIGDYAFRGCTNLTSMTLGSSVKSIGQGAFYECSGFTSIDVPDSVISIGNGAFGFCQELKSVTLGSGLKTIGNGAFNNCGGLTSIDIPDSVISIGSNAFMSCGGLTSIDIPDSVISIGSNAFMYCGLTSVTIGSGVTLIGERAFLCYWLESITVDTNNKNYSSQDGILYNKEKTEFVHIPGAIKGDVTIPDGVTEIWESAFPSCSGLTSITIPDSVTLIGERAFYNCSGLTDIQFQGTVEEWQAIEKEEDWDKDTADYTVTCTDGTVDQDGNVTYFDH